jgi:integrase
VASVEGRIQRYLENYPSGHRAPSTRAARQRLAHVERLLGKYTLFDLTEDRIHGYIRARLSEGVSGRTVNMEVGELSRALKLKWSVAWPNVRKLEENHDVGEALAPEQEQRLVEAAAGDSSANRNPCLYALLQTALKTGMREGEICSQRWSGIDLENGVVTVGRKSKTKRSSGREIPMSPELRAILEQHAAWYAEKFGPIQPEWYLFPGGVTRAMKPDVKLLSVKRSWATARRRAGIECRFHDLRHTFATKLAEDPTVSDETMKSIMGHMSRAMLERYSHIRMAAKREAVKAADRPRRTEPEAKTAEIPDGVPKDFPKVKRFRDVQ